MKKNLLHLVFLFCILLYSCNREPDDIPTGSPLNFFLPEFALSPEEISVTKANIQVTITERGNINISSIGLVWDKLSEPDTFLSTKILLSPPFSDTIHFSLAGLEENSRYYCRLFFESPVGIHYSDQIVLQTGLFWSKVNEFPGGPLSGPGTFVANERVYIGGGFPNKIDFHSYSPISNIWSSKELITDPSRGLNALVSFEINSIGYFGTGTREFPGSGFQPTKSFWAFTEQAGWEKKKDFEGDARQSAVGFSISGKGYIGLGQLITGLASDFWMYDPQTDDWTILPQEYPGGKRAEAIAFVMNNKAYVGFGVDQNGFSRDDLWEFDPSQPDPWKEVSADIIPPARKSGFVFVANGSAYLGGGVQKMDFWRFSINDNGYFWEKLPDLPFGILAYSTGIGMLKTGLVIGGRNTLNNLIADVWQYTPE